MAPQIFDRMPNATELARYGAIWIAGLDAQKSQSLAEAGRDAGALVNVEDVVELCDFHTPAVVRRGRLTLAAGTGGASPAVARAARERLEQAFTADWAAALDDIADARTRLRKNGAGFDALVADARARLTQHGLS
jgi:precorrin-2 dehydrogenase/sirohydrochlorin ferrochelatase